MAQLTIPELEATFVSNFRRVCDADDEMRQFLDELNRRQLITQVQLDNGADEIVVRFTSLKDGFEVAWAEEARKKKEAHEARKREAQRRQSEGR